jgi:asparaginyl-tRNA synthetase
MFENLAHLMKTQAIGDLPLWVGQTVELQGWVMARRSSKDLVFLVMRDGSGLCQCVADRSILGDAMYDEAETLAQESAFACRGEVIADPRQIGGHEVRLSGIRTLHLSKDYPITPKEHGVDFLMDHRHLWLRSKRQWAIMRIRNTLIMAIHRFFQDRGFVQMDAPIFTDNACEGTSTLFATDFYGHPAYLSQSGQLYGEAMAMAMGKIYTFGPTFRAEKSKTRRHLSEFWMIEPEMAFCDLRQNMDLIEEFLREVVCAVLERNRLELELIERPIEPLQKVTLPFQRIPYEEAVQIIRGERPVNGRSALDVLREDLEQVRRSILETQTEISEREAKLAQPGLKKGEIGHHQAQLQAARQRLDQAEEQERNLPQWIASASNFESGNDFGGSDETVLTRLFETPVMVYNWPHEVKAFYMKRDEDDPRWAKGVDVLAPEGYGEIVGGGERETNLEWLVNKIHEHQLPMEAFEWYLDLRRYGSVPHAGFGLGLERLVAWVCKLPHVRETIPFPRMYGRIAP